MTLNEGMLTDQGFRLGELHREAGSRARPRHRAFWHPAYVAGYDAGLLGDGDRSAIQILRCCRNTLPMLDLGGCLIETGLLSAGTGLLTDRGEAAADVLLALRT
jgi:hypothetical protein